MPLTAKGQEILAAMRKQYGAKKGKEVFYASENKGTIKGVHKEAQLMALPLMWQAMRRRAPHTTPQGQPGAPAAQQGMPWGKTLLGGYLGGGVGGAIGAGEGNRGKGFAVGAGMQVLGRLGNMWNRHFVDQIRNGRSITSPIYKRGGDELKKEDITKDAYWTGFVQQCATYGVDPEKLLKTAFRHA